MIIGIDGRVLEEGNGGVFVYAKNVIEALVRIDNRHQYKIFLNKARRTYSPHIEALRKEQNVSIHAFRFPNKFLNASMRFKSWPKIDVLIGGCDVLFFPTMLYSAWSKNTKTVLTMHDVSFAHMPEFYTKKQQLWHALLRVPHLCRSVDKLIAVSDSTKQDMVHLYAIPEKKIIRVHSGVEADYRPIVSTTEKDAFRCALLLPHHKKIILQTGTIQPRKNNSATLCAFEQFVKTHPSASNDYILVFAGHTGWKSKKLIRAIKKSSLCDRIYIRTDIERANMPLLYSLADIFVYPSFYEGFGHPLLEAFSCGIPAIASSVSSLGEVAGNAACMVHPYKVDELTRAILRLATDTAYAKEARSRGIARSAEFTWEKTARETLRVLTSV